MKSLSCIVCGNRLSIRTAQGRKSNKPFIMIICSESGKHFRAFITDQLYVKKFLESVEDKTTN